MWFSRLLLGIFLIGFANQVRQASASNEAAQQTLDTLELTNCRDELKDRLACLQFKYRTINGTCNNLCNVTQGAIGRPLQRFRNLEAEYQQPNDQPRSQTVNNQPLPNPREISRQVFRSNTGNPNGNPNFTHITMTWGQFIDHDVTLTELTPNVECGNNFAPCVNTEDGCIVIPLNGSNENDRLEFNLTAECIPLRRSLRVNSEQVNEITSYIDGSQVYGSDDALALRLRDTEANLGLLDVSPYINTHDRPRLPDADAEAFCRSTDSSSRPCFLAGDIRVNENHALMAMHLIWVREHNRIANILHVLNPLWDDERLYQEARKIVGAEIQHITYNEFLAVLFPGEELRRESGLLLESKGSFFTQYDQTVNAEMFNSFSTAAFRMGHTLIRDTFVLLDPNFGRSGFDEPNELEVRDFFNPDRFYQEGDNAYGGILLGLLRFFAQNFDPTFVPAVRERLIIEGLTFEGIVGDLPAINILRGRDHGLPGYAKFREACGRNPAHSFDDIADTVSEEQRRRLKNVYGVGEAVKDVDLFAGGISETAVPGSVLGFTFTCLITEQFKNLRFGDRFWYERDDHQTGFTIEQLDQIRHTSLAKVICDNTDDVRRIHPWVFLHRNAAPGLGIDNNPVFCDELPFADLTVFKDESGVESESNAEAGGGEAGEAGASVGA